MIKNYCFLARQEFDYLGEYFFIFRKVIFFRQ